MYVCVLCMLDYSQRTGEVSSLDDCNDDGDNDDDDDDDVANLHLMDSDADEEFECDCPVCQMHQQHISGISRDASLADCIK